MARPDSIPNSAVKRCIADGSACLACARVGSRQIYFLKTGTNVPVFLCPELPMEKRRLLDSDFYFHHRFVDHKPARLEVRRAKQSALVV